MTATPTGFRQQIPLMRAALYVGSFLVFLAGIQLFVLTTRTDHYFAWTIANPLTAAFLGAFYWTAIPVGLLSARQRVWANARVGVPGVLVFLWATLLTTLLHVGKFHFSSSDQFAKGAAWLWLFIYAADPVLVSVALALQLRAKGGEPPRASPLPGWYRSLLILQAIVNLAVGVILFARPSWAAGWWPWALTPLTARAMASWLLALGVVLATAYFENDWVRVRAATAAYAVLGFLELVALARYGDQVSWAGPAAWTYLVLVVSVLFAGAYGSWRVIDAVSGTPLRAGRR
jgi:hypothetical protein